ncbi:MAG: 3-oxoacyl-ACP reductase FabG [Proteobacteria bacterium]|nr:3-oxoacyl-ACP reductase FabG [Pseudomonadota bacterium]MBI3498186.1 3-oxoacyl-ACP reductase FabG [Pseudomonadota bacterium]
MELEGRVALVTGASRNIGRAIALELAAAGASIIVNARTAAADAERVAGEIASLGGQAMAVLADVTQEAEVARMVVAAIERFGRIDILVNNAAVRTEAKLEEIDFQAWRGILAVILDGAFLCAKACLPHLRRSDRASIVNIGGLTAHTGAKDRVHVVSAKAGLVGLTRALAHDLADAGITVNCVAPGMVDTVRQVEPGHHATRKAPLGRLGRPEEIAGAVRYLAGPTARFITGQTIQVNGGMYMS